MRRLPVPAEALVFTVEEWRRLVSEGSRLGRTIASETVWVLGEPPPAPE